MNVKRIAVFSLVVLFVATAIQAADSRTYARAIEPVWDEAVKASRDAELELLESSRAEHWFTLATPKKTLSKSVSFEVRLAVTGDGTTVTVREIDAPGTKKSLKAIAAFFNALDKRMR